LKNNHDFLPRTIAREARSAASLVRQIWPSSREREGRPALEHLINRLCSPAERASSFPARADEWCDANLCPAEKPLISPSTAKMSEDVVDAAHRLGGERHLPASARTRKCAPAMGRQVNSCSAQCRACAPPATSTCPARSVFGQLRLLLRRPAAPPLRRRDHFDLLDLPGHRHPPTPGSEAQGRACLVLQGGASGRPKMRPV